MALKITAQIGTDKGITAEAYVRIADYQVSKYGSANFRIELFQSQPVAAPSIGYPATGNNQARNQEIGENLWVAMTKQVEATRTVQKSVEVDVAETVEVPAHKAWVVQDVEEVYFNTVADLSALETGTIFDFGYSHLKEKLVGLFGAESIVDC